MLLIGARPCQVCVGDLRSLQVRIGQGNLGFQDRRVKGNQLLTLLLSLELKGIVKQASGKRFYIA